MIVFEKLKHFPMIVYEGKKSKEDIVFTCYITKLTFAGIATTSMLTTITICNELTIKYIASIAPLITAYMMKLPATQAVIAFFMLSATASTF